MKTLYNKYNMLNDDGQQLHEEFYKAIKKILSRTIINGYNPREISHILISEIMTWEAQTRILQSINKRKNERFMKELVKDLKKREGES